MSAVVSLPTKILVAVDGSDPSMKALNYASRLAALTSAKILALHVILLPSAVSAKTMDQVRKDSTAKGNEILNVAISIAKKNSIEIETRIAETDRSVEMTIVDLATKEEVDLIVLGTQGTTGYGRLMLGSTAAGAVSFAKCSVLAVR